MIGKQTNVVQTLLLAAASAMLIFTTPTPALAQGNLLVNGSFEDGSGSFTNWTVQPSPGGLGVVIVSSATSGLPQAVGSTDGYYIAQFAYDGGSISQTIPTVAGAFYVLELSAVAFSGTNHPTININGSLLGTLNFNNTLPPDNVSVDNSNWQSFSYDFQATSTITSLSFNYNPQLRSVYNGITFDNYWGSGGFDNISVTAVGVPEPSTLALAVVALLGGLAVRSLKRRST